MHTTYSLFSFPCFTLNAAVRKIKIEKCQRTEIFQNKQAIRRRLVIALLQELFVRTTTKAVNERTELIVKKILTVGDKTFKSLFTNVPSKKGEQGIETSLSRSFAKKRTSYTTTSFSPLKCAWGVRLQPQIIFKAVCYNSQNIRRCLVNPGHILYFQKHFQREFSCFFS